jgi:acyl dehydratase
MTPLALPRHVVARLDGWRGRHLHRPAAARLAAYAAVTEDARPERRDGTTASPTYAFVPLSECLFPLLDETLGEHGRARVIHVSHEFTFWAPVRAGAELRVSAEVTGLRDSPFGVVVQFRATTVDGHGVRLNEQRADLLVREATLADAEASSASPGTGSRRTIASATAVGSPPADTAEPANLSERAGLTGRARVRTAAGLTQAYAAASGDDGPLHTDLTAARRQGYTGLVVQGMCTLAMTCHAVERAVGSPAPPSALRVRFARPVYQGDELTVRFGRLAAHPGVVHFDVANRRRRTVLPAGALIF